jgi:2-dehydro-3-deoxy-L-rhamnonate dehydrogenase (NAD+)
LTFLDLSGQVAVVTGAGQGIGEAIAARLASAGAQIVVADLHIDSASQVAGRLRSQGAKAEALELDVSGRASVEALFEQVVGQSGRVDILVNNAGIAGRAAPIWEQSDEDWQSVVDVNLKGVFLCCRAVMPIMRDQNYGRVVNIASVAGKEGNPNMVPYSATKAGVIAMTKSIAKEVATQDICVNAVTPTVIRTPILNQLTEEQVEYMTARIPRRRTGTVEEVAAVVHFLCSRDCSFVTGQTYDVSGGRSTY